MDFWNLIKNVAPAAATIYGISEQQKMMKKHSRAQQKSYDKYLSAINPPAGVKEARFNELRRGILERAPGARRGTANRLAARGIRGQGPAAPIAEKDEAIQRSVNDAYSMIYGQYNVPSQPGPTDYAPSFWNLMGSNIGDIGSHLLAKRLGENDWWNWGGSGGGGTTRPPRSQSSTQVLDDRSYPTKPKDPWGWPEYTGPQQW